MGLINTEGYYKGTITSGGFGVTAKGLPQSVWMLKASEVYDPEGQEYLPADSEADEITAYLCMFNHNGSENFNNPQIKKVTGWDGADFNVLSEMDLEGVELSFRVEYGKGDYIDRLGVGRIDVPDASPTRTVTKLDKAEIDALQAKYAGGLAKTKTPTKAVSAKRKGKGKAPTGDPVSSSPAGAAPPKTSTPPKPPKAPKTTTAAATAAVGKCTDQEAYDACYALSGATEGDEVEKKLNEIWRVEAIVFNKDETQNTPEQWYQIKEKVLKQVSKV